MTSHHDVAGVVADLHVYAKDWRTRAGSKEIVDRAIEVLKSQAKEIEFQRRRANSAEEGWRKDVDSWSQDRARLAEAMKVIEPFAKAGELFGPRDPDSYDQCIYGPAAGEEYSLKGDHLRAARAFTNAAKTQESKDA